MNEEHKAVFLDRDGTLIHNRHYGCDPAQIELIDGVVDGLLALQDASYRLVVATNQGGVARGYFDERQLVVMHRRLTEILADHGVTISAVYYCPHHPEGVVPEYAVTCDCRKPQPGMVLRAAHELHIDPAVSWFVGDILDDVEAGNRAGCRGILLDVGTEGRPVTVLRTPLFVARDLRDAARFILSHSLRERAAAES